MVFNLWYLLYATITYAVIAWLRAHLAERRFQRWAKEQGAEPAHRATALKLPYGIDGIITATWKIMSGADIMDDLVVPRMQNLRATTLEIKVPNLVSNDYLVETFEPKNVQAVLATKFEDFEIGEKRHRAFRVLLGKSIFTSDGEFWAHSRALFRPVFNRESINDLEETDRAAKILIDLVSQNEGPNGWTPEVNLMDHFFRFTLDTSTAFLFGENAGSQLGAAGKLEDGATFDPNLTETFKVAQEWLQWRMVAGSFYWMITTAKWRRAAKAVLDFVDHYVQLALKRKKDEDEGKGGSSGRYNLLSELATRCHDPLELRDQILGEPSGSCIFDSKTDCPQQC
jgi:cytochrome P450